MEKVSKELDVPLPESEPPRKGKLRGRTRVVTPVPTIAPTEREGNEQRLLLVVEKLKALQQGASAAQEMAEVIQFVEEEE